MQNPLSLNHQVPKRIANIEQRVVGIKLHLLLSDSKIDLRSARPLPSSLQFHFYFQASTASWYCSNAQPVWHVGTTESDYRHQAGAEQPEPCPSNSLSNRRKNAAPTTPARWDQLCVNLKKV